MVENKDNIKSEDSGLPPVGASIKNAVPQASSVMKGSFQLDDKGKDKLPDKGWIHWALIIIPVLLLISIVVILYAFYLKPEPSKPAEQSSQVSQGTDSPPPDYVKASPLPIVSDEDEKGILEAYLAGKSQLWRDEFISKVSAEAALTIEEYEGADSENKLIAARELYAAVANPGADDRDPDWLNFIINFREKLEEEIGQSLY